MKKLVYAFASLSLIALVGLASCKKSEDVKEFSINSTKLTLGISETKTLTVSNYNGTVEWSISGDAATITPSNGADCKVTGVKEGEATVTAKNGDKTVSCAVTVKKAAADFPEISNPGAGKAVVAFYYEGSDVINCNGITFHGTNDAWTSVSDVEFEAIEGYAGWYKAELELAANPFDRDGHEALYVGKACLLLEDGTVDSNWSTQWGTCTIDPDHGDSETAMWGNEGNDLILTTSSVIYIMVPSFKTNPCVQSQTYTFKIKLPALCDESDVVSLIGTFNNWTDTDMEYNPSTGYFEAEVEGQPTSQFKIRKNATWDEELQHKVVDPETGLEEWVNYGDTDFGDNTTIVLDKSADGWKNCLPE
jgi:hypothetical protein